MPDTKILTHAEQEQIMPGKTQSKVLFVDDEKNILKSFTRLLDDTELELVVASSGEEALPVF